MPTEISAMAGGIQWVGRVEISIKSGLANINLDRLKRPGPLRGWSDTGNY
jgi:hypothetical protein